MAFQGKTVVETRAWRGLSLPKGRVGEWAGLASGGGHSGRAGAAGAEALRQECPSSSDTAGLEGMEGRWGQKVMRVRTTEGLWSLRLCSEGGGSPGAFQAGGRGLT